MHIAHQAASRLGNISASASKAASPADVFIAAQSRRQ